VHRRAPARRAPPWPARSSPICPTGSSSRPSSTPAGCMPRACSPPMASCCTRARTSDATNAMDKVVGRALLDGIVPLGERILCVSGTACRSSSCRRPPFAGAPILVGVGAPSSLAILAGRRSRPDAVRVRAARANERLHAPAADPRGVSGALTRRPRPTTRSSSSSEAHAPDRRADDAERGDEAHDDVLLGEPLHVGLGVGRLPRHQRGAAALEPPRARARSACRRARAASDAGALVDPRPARLPRTPPARPATRRCGCRSEKPWSRRARRPSAGSNSSARRLRIRDRAVGRATGPAGRRGCSRAHVQAAAALGTAQPLSGPTAAIERASPSSSTSTGIAPIAWGGVEQHRYAGSAASASVSTICPLTQENVRAGYEPRRRLHLRWRSPRTAPSRTPHAGPHPRSSERAEQPRVLLLGREDLVPPARRSSPDITVLTAVGGRAGQGDVSGGAAPITAA